MTYIQILGVLFGIVLFCVRLAMKRKGKDEQIDDHAEGDWDDADLDDYEDYRLVDESQ